MFVASWVMLPAKILLLLKAMGKMASGLWYFIKNEGSGRLFAEKDKISFNYVCSFLDGTECYNSDKLGPKEVILGKSEIEAGLNE